MKGYYVYRFLDERGEIIYIGRSITFLNRMNTHKYKSPFYSKVKKIEYVKLPNYMDMVITEKILIHNIKPKHNKKGNIEGDSMYSVPNLEWSEWKDKKEIKKPVRKPPEKCEENISDDAVNILIEKYGFDAIKVIDEGKRGNRAALVNDRTEIDLVHCGETYFIHAKLKPYYKYSKSVFVGVDEMIEGVEKIESYFN